MIFMARRSLVIAVIAVLVVIIGVASYYLSLPPSPTPTTTTPTPTSIPFTTPSTPITPTTPTTPTTTTTPTTPTKSPTETTPVEKRKLYVSHWGFGWDTIYQLVIKPFEEKYNVEVVLIAGTTSERFTKLVKGVEPVPDIIFLPDYYTYRAAQQGLLMKLNLSRLGNYQYIYGFIRENLPSYVRDYGVPHTIQDLGIAYRADRHSKVTSWKDLWREDFRNTIIWPAMTATSGPMALVMTAYTYTGDIHNVDVAFEKLKELHPYIVAYYTRSGDPQLYMERGEADIVPILRYNWGPLKNLSLPIEIVCPLEGSVYVLNLISIVNGSKNVDLAYEFIDYWISKEVQQKLSDALIDAPINSLVKVPAGHPFDISCVVQKPIYLDPKFLAENLEAWVNKWKEITG
jgi:putative spermidine/putrescine transport system substrate-binding protein